MLIRRLVDFVGCAGKLGAAPGDQLRILWRLTKNLRVRAGLGRHHPAEVYSIHTRHGHLFLRDNFGDITNVVTLIYHDAYRARRLPSPGVILDAGANIGLAAAWLGWHNPDLAVYCFEPIPESAQLIRRNCPRAVVINKALGDRAGNVRLRVDTDNVIASSIETAWRHS